LLFYNWIQTPQLDPSVGGGEVPHHLPARSVAAILPGGDLTAEGGHIWNPPIQALRGHDGAFTFSDSKPAPVFRRTMPGEARRQAMGFFRISNFLVGALLALAAVAQKQDMRSGIGTARSVAGANQLFQLGAIFARQFDMRMFTHVAVYNIPDEKKEKSNLTKH